MLTRNGLGAPLSRPGCLLVSQAVLTTDKGGIRLLVIRTAEFDPTIAQHGHDPIPQPTAHHVTDVVVSGGAALTCHLRQTWDCVALIEGVQVLNVREGDLDEALVGLKQLLGQ